MPTPFSVEGSTPGSVVWSVDSSGDTSQIGTINAPYANIGTTNVQAPTFTGIIVENNGINTSGSVNILTGTAVGGTATLAIGTGGTQLADITRDYMVYFNTTATGSATIRIGPSQGNANQPGTVFVGSAAPLGALVSFRCPAGWFVSIAGGTVTFAQTAISC